MGFAKGVLIFFTYIILAFFINAFLGEAAKILSPSFSSPLCFGIATFFGPAVIIWLLKKYFFSNMAD